MKTPRWGETGASSGSLSSDWIQTRLGVVLHRGDGLVLTVSVPSVDACLIEVGGSEIVAALPALTPPCYGWNMQKLAFGHDRLIGRCSSWQDFWAAAASLSEKQKDDVFERLV